jgi:hypothetical protein
MWGWHVWWRWSLGGVGRTLLFTRGQQEPRASLYAGSAHGSLPWLHSPLSLLSRWPTAARGSRGGDVRRLAARTTARCLVLCGVWPVRGCMHLLCTQKRYRTWPLLHDCLIWREARRSCSTLRLSLNKCSVSLHGYFPYLRVAPQFNF